MKPGSKASHVKNIFNITHSKYCKKNADCDQEALVARCHWLSCFADLEKIQKISHILRKRNSQTSA